jgi:DnaA N-terminal domain
VSRSAIAAALALEEVAGGERLVAFSLASFANRKQVAWPGTPSAAARAALARSRYLEARSRLLNRGLIESHETGGGRGRCTTVLLRFGEGPRFDGPINAELFETVLCYSRSSGPARLLLASIAALANEDGELDGVTADELCAAAGLAARTYRRARNALIASGELELVRGVGGRGHANCWRIPDMRVVGEAAASRQQRRPPSGPARPLMAPATPPVADVQPAAAGHATYETKSPRAALNNRMTSTVKGGQVRTVFAETRPERGPQRGPQRGPPNARAWKEPENLRTSEHPPNPPEGGLHAGELFVEQVHVTERGRERKRFVRVDVDAVCRELMCPSLAEREIWVNARALMRRTVGESMFDIWLASVELAAVDREGSLVLAAPEVTLAWLQKRFGRLISRCCEQSGRGARFALPQERVAIQHRPQAAASAVVGEQATMNRRVS